MTDLTAAQLSDMISASNECGDCTAFEVCPAHFEAFTLMVRAASSEHGNDVLWSKTLIACFNPTDLAWVTGVFLALRDGNEAQAMELAGGRRTPWGKDGEPTDRAVEALARHLWGASFAPGRRLKWDDLATAARRQWREDARRYLQIAARAETPA